MTARQCIILHIDDDQDDVFLLQRAIIQAAIPCDVRAVSTPHEAQDYLNGVGAYSNRQRFPLPNLIVTDLAFRGGCGLEFLEWLRSDANFSSLRVVCATGSEDPERLKRAASFDAECVPKNAVFREVTEVIAKCCAKSSL